ncbi:hypothetical protein UPYG_G00042510, partial [Umbra pygmaea]
HDATTFWPIFADLTLVKRRRRGKRAGALVRARCPGLWTPLPGIFLEFPGEMMCHSFWCLHSTERRRREAQRQLADQILGAVRLLSGLSDKFLSCPDT